MKIPAWDRGWSSIVTVKASARVRKNRLIIFYKVRDESFDRAVTDCGVID